jgi:hypothetical protein
MRALVITGPGSVRLAGCLVGVTLYQFLLVRCGTDHVMPGDRPVGK